MTDAATLLLAGGAAIAGGAINAIAGGGSLVTFPSLVALGLPPVVANVTNTVALCPGYLGATLAQRRELAGQRARLALLVPVAALAGAAGAWTLLHTSARAFAALVPYLLLAAAALVAVQERVRTWLAARTHPARAELLAVVPVAAAGVYGGYFGAGMGVILLAALGVTHADSLVRLNAAKQVLSLAVNVVAAGVFVARGTVAWPVAAAMAGGALAGGALGGAVAARVPARVLRWAIVAVGVAVAIAYLVRG